MKARLLTSVATLVALTYSGAAFAQAADDAGADPAEIIVTANKRVERVQEVPSSIAVVNSEALENQGVTRLEDLQRAVPGLAMTSSTGQSHSTIAVRGVFSNNISAGIPSAVGVVIDDLPQPVDARGFNELVDIERIEVLRGPQSTISGRNSAAGLINIVTRGPSKTLKVDLSQTITTDEEYRTAAFVSGPLGDSVGASLSGYYNNWAGNVRNLDSGKKQGKESYGVRSRLEVEPAEGVKFQLMGYYQRLNEKQGTPIYQGFGPGAALLGFIGSPDTLFGPNITFDRNNQLVNSPTQVYQHSDSYGGSLRATFDVGKLQLMSISGYQREDNDTVQDAFGFNDATLNAIFYGFWDGAQRSQGKLKVESQEFRLISPDTDRLSYVFGLFYSNTEQNAAFQRAVFIPYETEAFLQYKNYAAYLRANFKVSDQVSLLGGLRYNSDHVRYTQDLTTGSGAGSSANKASDDHLLGDISLQYRPEQDVMLYGRYARGLQGTGFDLNAPINPPAITDNTPIQPLAPGGVDSFEIGAKTQFLDRRLTLNFSAYNSIFQNYLSQQVDTQLNFTLVNVGKVRARGFEVEGSFKASDNFNLYVSGAYTDATYRSYNGAACYISQTVAQGCVGKDLANGISGSQDLTGKRLAVSPEWQMSGGFEYVAKLPSAPFDISFRADASYQSKVFFDSPGSPNNQNAYAIVNLSATLVDHNDHWKLTAFVNNVTDKEHIAGYADIGGVMLAGVSGLQTRSLPRDFRRYGGVRLNLTF